MLKELIILTLSQIFLLFGALIAFGLILGLIEKNATKNLLLTVGKSAIVITGLIGTTIHELSHTFFCVIFRHRILEIKLFKPDFSTGVMGYVNHSYNKKSWWQQIGNFMIGIGPIVMGSLILWAILAILLPESREIIKHNFDNVKNLNTNIFSQLQIFGGVFADIFQVLIDKIGSLNFWIFLFLGIAISSHMSLSTADLKGAAEGFIFILIIMLALNFLLLLVDRDAAPVWLSKTNIIVAITLSLAIFLSFINLIFSVILISIKKVIRR